MHLKALFPRTVISTKIIFDQMNGTFYTVEANAFKGEFGGDFHWLLFSLSNCFA